MARPVMYQKWRNLLFLHWSYPSSVIAASLPEGLEPETFDGQAWLGVVPFFMRDIRPRFCPAVPGLSNFLELNLRTYVRDREGRAAVWFYSLDANRWLAVKVARRFFHLPYHLSAMRASAGGSSVAGYTCRRPGFTEPCLFDYSPRGDEWTARPGTFEHFLVERYVLFAMGRGGRLYSGGVRHDPYPLRQVNVGRHESPLIEWAGLPRPGRPPDHALFSRGVDVEVEALTAP